MVWRRCCAFILLLVVPSLYSQSSRPDSVPVSTFSKKVRVVLLDVVVSAGKDEPVPGLRKKDFEVWENGKPQVISSFEEHKGAGITQIKLPPMPPHIYSNYPTVKNSDSVNVLLLDGLNTAMRDQTYVHTQLIKYLKTIPPGTRVAIFTLSSRLRMIQPVTSDSAELLAVLNNPKSGAAGPHPSPLLRSDVEKQADQHTIDFMMQESHAPDSAPNLAEQAVSPINAMVQFLGDTAAFQTESRARITLQALQELARYLSTVPGRKNVMWFSGSFPTGILPNPDTPDPFSSVRDLEGEVHKTADLLAANQIAIYPIGAEGLAADSQYEANGAEIGEQRGMLVTRDQVSQLRSEGMNRASSHTAMEVLAKETGGEAFYDTNGLGAALLRAINDGARYYTLSYSPTDDKMDGQYRHIEVKVLIGKYKLSYRRGYYADDLETFQAAGRRPDVDPLVPLMAENQPYYSQILCKVRVLPSTPQPAADAPRAGNNTDLKGPFTRYVVDFAIAVQDFKFEITPDGLRHGNIEVMLVAYDHEGKPVNMVEKKAGILLKPDTYKAFETVGLQLKSEIDVPKGENVLRVGVYDPGSSKAGTLAVPLSEEPVRAGEKN
jgi:VWFA-related protein